MNLNEILQTAVTQIGEPGGLFDTAKMFVEERFGTPGLIAAGLLLASIAALLLSKAVKMSFDIVKYVAVPSVALSFIATYFVPVSFMIIFPVMVALFSVVLIVKG